jgi:hypothetical protein
MEDIDLGSVRPVHFEDVHSAQRALDNLLYCHGTPYASDAPLDSLVDGSKVERIMDHVIEHEEELLEMIVRVVG